MSFLSRGVVKRFLWSIYLYTPFSSRLARAEKFSILPREAQQLEIAVRIFVKKVRILSKRYRQNKHPPS